jgi:hypothetical protein
MYKKLVALLLAVAILATAMPVYAYGGRGYYGGGGYRGGCGYGYRGGYYGGYGGCGRWYNSPWPWLGMGIVGAAVINSMAQPQPVIIQQVPVYPVPATYVQPAYRYVVVNGITYLYDGYNYYLQVNGQWVQVVPR